MKKFKVTCDPNTHAFGSASIIVNETNQAAKNLDLYSDSDSIIHYDCLCNSHGIENINAFWCAFELPFVKYILQNAYPKNIFGLSKDNITLAAYAGYPTNLLNYSILGVNRTNFPLTTKKYMKNKFVFLAFDESSSRSNLNTLVEAFGKQFQYNQNVVLYLKDRLATETFKIWVKEQAIKYGVEIIHNDEDIHNFKDQVKIYEHADAAICLNHSHSFGMCVMQGMSCGLPTITTRYNGFTDYISELTAACVKFTIEDITQEKIDYLVSIGMKNHLFPITRNNYTIQPFWCEPDIEDVRLQMQKIVDDSLWRESLSKMSDLVASWHNWERTCINLSYILSTIK